MNNLAVYGLEAAGLLMAGSVVAIGALRSFSAASGGAPVAEPVGGNNPPLTAGRPNDGPAARPRAEDAAKEAELEGFAFSGRHLIASYTGCCLAALRDVEGLTSAMHAAVAASGATLLQSVRHIFLPDGMTAVMLLSESHASIHTYPEHRSCFIDIFTCGSNCQVEAFDSVLRGFLRPLRATRRIIERNDEIVDEMTLDADAVGA